jgi:hypothetical protein
MLIDKGYYDYDFNVETIEKAKPKAKIDETRRKAAWERMGFGHLRKPAEKKSGPLTAEEAQRIAMEEIKKQKDRRK